MKPTLFVLLPEGSKSEFVQAREALGRLGVTLSLGAKAMHYPGQTLNGDVLVVGDKPHTIDADATGDVYTVPDMAALTGWNVAPKSVGDYSALQIASEPEQTPELKASPAPPPAPDSGSEPELGVVPDPEPEPDQFDGMTRVQLIQHAADKWPGMYRWANMADAKLRTTIREMGAKD